MRNAPEKDKMDNPPSKKVNLLDVVYLQTIYMESFHLAVKRQQSYLLHMDIQAAHKELREYPAIVAQLEKMLPGDKQGQDKLLSGVISGSWDLADRSFLPVVKALEQAGFKIISGKRKVIKNEKH